MKSAPVSSGFVLGGALFRASNRRARARSSKGKEEYSNIDPDTQVLSVLTCLLDVDAALVAPP